VSETGRFDPYAVFEALGRERVSYVVAGGLARVVHGSGETTRNVDVVPLLREDNLRRLAHALEGLGATGRDGNRLDATELAAPGRFAARTGVGEIGVVAYPWRTSAGESVRRSPRLSTACACSRRASASWTGDGWSVSAG
jgi:hypothetical protein